MISIIGGQKSPFELDTVKRKSMGETERDKYSVSASLMASVSVHLGLLVPTE